MPVSEMGKAVAAGRRAAKVAQMGACVALGHALTQKPQALKENIMKHLEEHPDEVEPCWMMLEQGFCDPQKAMQATEAGEDTIPSSASTLNAISAKVLKETLNQMHPELFTIPLLAKLGKQGRKTLTNLFCFCVQEAPSAPTPTHKVSAFCEAYKQRYNQLGKRGTALKIVEGNILWGKTGTYCLENDEAKNEYTHIVHVSGIKVAQARKLYETTPL